MLGAFVVLAGVLPVGAQAQPSANRSVAAVVQYAGRAGFFVGSPLQYRMVKVGERPYAPAYPYPEVIESSATVQVDEAAGTVTGMVVLAYRTLSTYGHHNGQTTYPGGTCTVVTRETSVLKYGTFDPTTRTNVVGKRDYSYQRVVEGFQRTPGAFGSGNIADCAWDPFTIERNWQGRWDDANYPTGNDDPAFIGKKYLSLYGSDVYEFIGRAFRDKEIQPKVPWLLMAYAAGDTPDELNAEYEAVLRRFQVAASNKNVRIVMLLDKGASAAYYEVQPSSTSGANLTYEEGKTKWAKGAVDMADPATLAAFVAWAKATYPAERTALVLMDHGNGLGGGMVDVSAGNKVMTLPKMGSALAAATDNGRNRIDVLYLGMCLMGMIEVAYQVRDYAGLLVASENEMFQAFDHNRRYAAGITATTTPTQLATLIATSYADDVGARNLPYTISVTDLGKLDGLAAATNGLGRLLGARMSVPLAPAALAARLSEARQDAQHFDSSGDMVVDAADAYIDLYGFAASVNALFADDPEVQAAARSVMDAVTAYVLTERHRTGIYQGTTLKMDGSRGVAVFFPPSASSFYSSANYAFAAGATWNPHAAVRGAGDTAGGWGPMLVTYFRTTQPNGPDNPTPPRPLAPLADAFRTFLPGLSRAVRP